MRGTLRVDQLGGRITSGTEVRPTVRLAVELAFRADECGDTRTLFLPEGGTLLQGEDLLGPGHRITVTVERVATPCGGCPRGARGNRGDRQLMLAG